MKSLIRPNRGKRTERKLGAQVTALHASTGISPPTPSTMSRTVCAEPRCPEPAVERGRCVGHQLTTSQRGYGAPHQAEREALRATLPAPCGYGCGKTLAPDDAWVAAHRVDGRPEYGYVAACQSCNLRARGSTAPASPGHSPAEAIRRESVMRVIG